MNTLPLVSIIIPNYNREQLIKETLASVLNQTYQNWECIIVDDESTDSSIHIINEFVNTDNRFKLIVRNRLPKGAPTCRNIGSENSNGDYVIFLDSDDLLIKSCIEGRINCFKDHPSMDFIVFNGMFFRKKASDLLQVWNKPTKEDNLDRFLRGDGVWQTSCPIYKRTFINNFPFDESLPFLQDYELAVRILLNRPKYTYHDDDPDILIRSHDLDSISQKGFFLPNNFEYKKQIFNSYLKQIQTNFKGDNKKFNNLFLSFAKIAIEDCDVKKRYKEPIKLLKPIAFSNPLTFALSMMTISRIIALYILSKRSNKVFINTRVILRRFFDTLIFYYNRKKPNFKQVSVVLTDPSKYNCC